MATLMTWGNSDGIKGRCDAKCHNANEPVCKCMCGGRFHGAAKALGGLDSAVREFWDEVIKDAEAQAEAKGLELRTMSPQLSLF